MNQQHKCPWPFCAHMVDADLWGCRTHWFNIPPLLRQALWRAYRPGQTARTASDDYRAAAASIDTWIALYLQTKSQPGAPAHSKPRKHQRDLPL